MSSASPDLIEATKEYFRRLDAGDHTIVELFEDDAEFYFPKFGVGRGRDQLIELMTGLGGVIERIEHDLKATAVGQTVFVEGTTRGALKTGERWAAGETPSGRFCNVFEYRNGRICRLAVYLDPDYGGLDEARFLWGREGRTW